MSFGIYAAFEADNEIDNSNVGDETTNFYIQRPVYNVYYIVAELKDVLQNTYYSSHLGYDSVNWFVEEVTKSRKKRISSLETLRKIL